MTVLQALILGAIQGLTEFVPVSSTAHLFLAQALMGIRNDETALSFDIVLHLGTAAALIASTWREIGAMLMEAVRWARGEPAQDAAGRAMLVPLVVGTVPGVLAGLFLLKRFEAMRSVGLIGASMLVAFAYFFFAEGVSDTRSGPDRGLADLDARDGLWIGLAQAAAGLMAGFSRSGFTIATGKLRRFSRPDAARFSFLLALPIILGAGAKALLDLRKAPGPTASAPLLLVGFAAAGVVGYLAIEVLIRFLKTHSLRPFGVYLGLLGLLLLAGTAFPGLLPFLPR
ncbi:MAG TPA: undecaprenyl-diphosphate phosphatase [Thermoanaerobaculia bacterium]|jgi:undecaprenyl-diphosphatase|nr:undecaprenyl-diphosphate phosphatase [Thermoanaerobaculia bacterium]